VVTRGRTLIFVGVIVVAFAASFTAGRALRPAGAPAAPAAGVKTIAVAEPTVSVPRFEADGGLPPLRVPRPPKSAEQREQAPPAAPDPVPAEPDDTAPPPSADPPAVPEAPPAPPPVDPAPEPEPPAPQNGGGGGWSSGN
jgi:protein TonB